MLSSPLLGSRHNRTIMEETHTQICLAPSIASWAQSQLCSAGIQFPRGLEPVSFPAKTPQRQFTKELTISASSIKKGTRDQSSFPPSNKSTWNLGWIWVCPTQKEGDRVGSGKRLPTAQRMDAPPRGGRAHRSGLGALVCIDECRIALNCT